ncbi:polyketide synthase [Aspergillus heteromorphus CBS 117.55]|uniref:Polyketide synthase n=1 Tax=Aspergillus heteromorphus CBS 117.55 TaxID=1448321 RepID=A0A317W4S4_9EURO|nr:polyketide synthase [Aspergillus heteromorphus CBS 117.55]PWY79190.1 polyketide synthase [Aspergillus heteromorphus CBS 117.55]
MDVETDRSAAVFLFGDQTIAFEHTLHGLLHVKDDALLTDLFDRVGFQLRRYVGCLPAHQQEWFPYFTTLIDLFAQHDKCDAAAALKFPLLCLTEIGQFIRYLGQGSRPYPAAKTTYLVGACTGSFAAAAIASAQTLTELLPAAVEAVIVAVRTAVRSLALQNDLEPVVEGRREWSVAIGTDESEARRAIESFNAEEDVASVVRLYISSVSRNSVSVSGPPRVLQKFVSSCPWKHSFLPIELPYHAAHLFRESDVDDIIKPFHDPSLLDYTQRIPIVSAASGELIRSSTLQALLSLAVQEALCSPLHWDRMTSSLSQELQTQQFPSCTIHQISSRSGPLLSTALSQSPPLQITTTLHSPSTPTGKFSQASIAIIGFSGRFPESSSNEEFWDMLLAGRDVHRTIPEDRFDWKAHYDPTGKTKNTSRVKYGCFIKEPGVFDARFFNMSPREAENANPAQRLAITTAYEAMEMAGLVPNATPSTQGDRIGVFYGATSDDWREVNSGQDVDTYFIPGGNRAFIPGRISYFFRFCGPSLSIDTACSSSCAAIQTACAYLWRGECDTALAGGVNVLTNPDNFAGLDRGHFLTAKGNCNAFDDEADGYCRSDAIGTVILKRIEDALEDNDPIFGVIRGAYTNHCGRTDSITRPFEGDQAAVFNRIMRYAGVDPLDVGYVEMHGTGTQAGDATEMKSVLSVFAPHARRQNALYLGTAKANMGHAESASGVSSLIKVLLMMRHNAIPPHCGIKTRINHTYPTDLAARNVHIASRPTGWRREDGTGGKRVVFLNNFSAAGGNTAMLVEDAPVREKGEGRDPRERHLVSVTAKTSRALKGNVQAMVSYLEQNPDVSLASLGYTTTARRAHHTYRVVVSGSDIASIRHRLQELLPGLDSHKPVPPPGKLPNLVMVFTGQGTVYAGLGKRLFDTIPSFRECVSRYNDIAEQLGFPSFLSLIHNTEDVDASPMVTHLALVCIQMALYNYWKSLGVVPAATIGHSLGEYPALYAAGVLAAVNVIYLVGTRAKLLSERTTPGTHGMLAVKSAADAIRSELDPACGVACLNQPLSNVVSGPVEQLAQLKARLTLNGVECVQLDIPYAFHSAQVDPILDDFKRIADKVQFRAPSIAYLSPLLGKVVPAGDTGALNAAYLTDACRQPVNFQGAVQAAQTEAVVNEKTLWVEIGSHPACSGMVKGVLGPGSTTVPSLRKGSDTWSVLSGSLEVLYSQGIDIHWTEYHRGVAGQREVLLLPRYAWDLKNYWIPYKNNFCLTKGEGLAPAVPQTETVRVPRYLSPSVQRILEQDDGPEVSTFLGESDVHDRRLAPILEGHVVNGAMLCPSSLYADIALTIAKHMLQAIGKDAETVGLDVADMQVQNPLVSRPEADSQLFRISAAANWRDNIISFRLFSVTSSGQKMADHAAFVVRTTQRIQAWLSEWKRSAHLIQSRIHALHDSAEDGDAHKLKRRLAYQLFASLVQYGSDYQGMQEVVLDGDHHEATARVSFQVGENGFVFNPCWVDSLGHIAGFIMNASDASPSKGQVFINHGWERMRCAVRFAKGKQYRVYNRMQLETGTTYVGDTYILEGDTVVAVYQGIRFQGVPRRLLDRLLPTKGPSPVASKDSITIQTPKPVSRQPVQPPTSPNSPAPAPSPSTGGIAARVMAIIAKEAGIDPADLGPNEEFANYGIDSLLSLTICGRIQEEVGADVPSSLFADYPTPKDLLSFFGGAEAESSQPTSSSSHRTDSASRSSYDTIVTEPEQDHESSIMDILRATIATETGIPADEITPTTPFTELGVDSLLALTIVGTLAETMEVTLPSTVLTDNRNLEEVRKTLNLDPGPVLISPSASSRSSPNPSPSPDPDPNTTTTTTTTKFTPTSPPHSTSILLWGNPRTASKTLFLFPDGSGSAASYASLPKPPSSSSSSSPTNSNYTNTAAYALNCPWLKTHHHLKTITLSQLTAKYLLEIRRRQPTGPYYLGDWSAGGICAYEAIRQLTATGETIARLILIDSPNPIGLENPPGRMYDFLQGLGLFGKKDVHEHGPVHGNQNENIPSWLRPHFDAFLILLDRYTIAALPPAHQTVQTHLLYAKDGICNDETVPRPEISRDDPREMTWLIENRSPGDLQADGWAELLGRANLRIEVLEGVNHFTMMRAGEHMRLLAGFLGRALGDF